MVIVSDYMEKVNATSGQTFVLLELSGGLELVQSQNTGNFYLVQGVDDGKRFFKSLVVQKHFVFRVRGVR